MSRALTAPELYGRKRFRVQDDPNKVPSGEADKIDIENIQKFIGKLDDAIRAGETKCEHVYTKTVAGQHESITLGCSWCEGSILMMPPGVATDLPALERKTRSCVDEAIEQLTTYDSEDKCAKFVLLNWQKPPACSHFDAPKASYRSFVKKLDAEAKERNSKLSIVLL